MHQYDTLWRMKCFTVFVVQKFIQNLFVSQRIRSSSDVVLLWYIVWLVSLECSWFMIAQDFWIESWRLSVTSLWTRKRITVEENPGESFLGSYLHKYKYRTCTCTSTEVKVQGTCTVLICTSTSTSTVGAIVSITAIVLSLPLWSFVKQNTMYGVIYK